MTDIIVINDTHRIFTERKVCQRDSSKRLEAFLKRRRVFKACVNGEDCKCKRDHFMHEQEVWLKDGCLNTDVC